MYHLTLTHPPIKEAIFEVLFNFKTEIDYNKLKGFKKEISEDFSKYENIVQINGNFSADSDNKLMRETIGIVFFSTNNISIQARKNGFALTFLNQSYSTWNNFFPVAYTYLEKYIEYFKPDSVPRFSLRFINEIDLAPNEKIEDYVLIHPSTDTIGKLLTSALIRMEIYDEDIDAIGVITELINPISQVLKKLYLDIDVIKNCKPIAQKIDLQELSKQFEELRQFKNHIFFSSITESATKKFNT